MDTIVAISTPVGVGGISIIRLSGNNAKQIALQVFSAYNKKDFEPRLMQLGTATTDKFKEKCLAVWFKSPLSYTGEDVVEFHCHGGIVIANGVLNQLVKCGARLAHSGEFSKRAFLNGKLTLAQAEGVMDMINAESESEVRAGYNLMQGDLSKKIIDIQEQLTKMIAKIEVVLDYPENEYEEQTIEETNTKITNIKQELEKILATSNTGRLVKNGTNVVILGKPNVGKSSLLNAILNFDRAIVTNIEGTTRDTLEETYVFNGVKFVLTDTAGVRDSVDYVEKIGIEKSRNAVNFADVVLCVIDCSKPLDQNDKEILDLIKNKPAVIVKNKTDLKPQVDLSNYSFENVIEISALNKVGITELKTLIYDLVIDKNIINSNLMLTNNRHTQSIQKAIFHCQECLQSLDFGNTLDIVSVDIKNLWLALGEISGNNNNEDIITEIFSGFCVGK